MSFGHVTLWNYLTGERTARFQDSGSRFGFSPDGRTLVTGADGPITVWDIPTQRITWTTNHKASVLWLAISPDGKKFANCNFGGGARIFDLASPDRSVVLRGHTARIWSMAFSPDSTQLAGGSSDQLIHLWDVSSWQTMGAPSRNLRGHGSEVHCLAYSHDGRFLASGDKAGNVLLWRIKPELNEDTITNVLVDYAYPPPVFSSNGDLMATVTASNQVTIWNLSRKGSITSPLAAMARRSRLPAAIAPSGSGTWRRGAKWPGSITAAMSSL